MKNSDLKIIRKINKEAWDKYGDDLLKEDYAAPNIRFVVDKALTEHRDMLTEEKIEQLEALKDQGYFDKKETKTDKDVAKKFDEFVDKRMKEEIEKGNLTAPEDDEDYKKFKKKQKQYERRKKRDNRKSQGTDVEAGGGE